MLMKLATAQLHRQLRQLDAEDDVPAEVGPIQRVPHLKVHLQD